jgi:hypothetical protein
LKSKLKIKMIIVCRCLERIQFAVGNDHLIEFHLIEIVIFQLIESFNNEYDHLIEFFETFQLIEFLG